jgi:hypothetical protein
LYERRIWRRQAPPLRFVQDFPIKIDDDDVSAERRQRSCEQTVATLNADKVIAF